MDAGVVHFRLGPLICRRAVVTRATYVRIPTVAGLQPCLELDLCFVLLLARRLATLLMELTISRLRASASSKVMDEEVWDHDLVTASFSKSSEYLDSITLSEGSISLGL